MENKFDFLIGEMVMWKGMGKECLEEGYQKEDVEDDFGLIEKVVPAGDPNGLYTMKAYISWCDGTSGFQWCRLTEEGKAQFGRKNIIYPVSEDDL